MTMLNEMNIDVEAKETAKKRKGDESVGWGKFDEPLEEKREIKEKKPKKLGCEYEIWDLI
jgi:hypothetical protein